MNMHECRDEGKPLLKFVISLRQAVEFEIFSFTFTICHAKELEANSFFLQLKFTFQYGKSIVENKTFQLDMQ